MGDFMKPCEVIASHTESGQVVPLKIKVYEGDESTVFVIKSYVELPQTYQKDIKRYRCKVVINDILRECELIFYKDNLKWFLAYIK